MPVLYPESDCSASVWALPRSLATTCGITVVFSSCGYLDVSVPHVSLRMTMDSSYGTRASSSGGFPHSEIHGSMAICASPWLIAACHVLLRLLVPRHSPYALYSLIHLISKVILTLTLYLWLMCYIFHTYSRFLKICIYSLSSSFKMYIYSHIL